MKQVLVTGATGNVGVEVIRYLDELSSDIKIIAAVRNVEKAKKKLRGFPNLSLRHFDFEHVDIFAAAFHQIDILFLLRPPHISKVDKVFRPLLNSAHENGVRKVVFLSVQGAEKSKVIPHNKIETLIRSLEFNYIFVRPSYFMQNLTTTLLTEIRKTKTISLPSRKAKFNWIDVKNIGEAAARFIQDFEKYQNASYEITGAENRNFYEVAELISEITEETIRFRSVNPIRFYFSKKKEGMAGGFVMVMIILHFLPRFQSAPEISDQYQKLTGKSPTTLGEFINREKEKIIT